MNGSNSLEVTWGRFPNDFRSGNEVRTGLLYKHLGSRDDYYHVHRGNGETSALLANLIPGSMYDLFVGTVNSETLLPGSLAKLRLITVGGIKPVNTTFCSEFYNLTAFPNVFGHKNQADALFHMYTFFPLLETMCSEDLKAFMCLAFLPPYNSSGKVIQKPCRSFCTKVQNRCAYAMNKLNFHWPKELECGKLPPEPPFCFSK